MLATIWNGTAKPRGKKRQLQAAWLVNNTYPRSYSLDDETDSDDELPDEMTTYADEPETPLRHHITLRYSHYS